MSTITIKSHFDPNDIDDTSNPYPRPLFLVPLPPLDCQLLNNANDEGRAVDMLAYGGDDGCIYLLNNHHSSSTNSSSTSNNNDENKNSSLVRTRSIECTEMHICVCKCKVPSSHKEDLVQ